MLMGSQNFQIAFGNYDKNPKSYYLSETNPLRATIFLALKLGKPLLITGEPGTGKTQLAYWAAWYLSSQSDINVTPFLSKPFVFNTKTNSAGRELFYQYDAISHFQDKAGIKRVAEFISLTAMGQAICQTHGRNIIQSQFGLNGIRNLESIQEHPHSSVLLIDEVDKASRDFTNDLLNEIENNRFLISEMEKEITKNEDRRTRSLVIMTSNSEKALPDAFLRRCLFYNVPFPSDDELLAIVLQRLGPFLNELAQESRIDSADHYRFAIRLFHLIRQRSVVKPPSISEFLDWLKVLHLEEIIYDKIDEKNIEYLPDYRKKALQLSLYTLIKTKEDLDEIEHLLKLK
jgi:MoxR-like ATPase